jgi:hypothetical protein
MAGGVSMIPGSYASPIDFDGDDREVSPKNPLFGARGDSRTDDTYALQSAVDYCFGSTSSPHGTARAVENRILGIPGGHYRITSPIVLSKLHGARVMGAGRFVTKITNSAGGPVFVTNGCGYSHFEGLYLESLGKTAAVFDLNWDGSSGGPALQSNTVIDIFFAGGAVGVDIGSG